MKIFKKRTQKSGYSTMTSEPISDLDPKRISALKNFKSKHHGDLDPKVILAIKSQNREAQDESDSKTVSLTPSPSLSKAVSKLKDASFSGSNSAGSPAGFTAAETITASSSDQNPTNGNNSPIHKRLFTSASDGSSGIPPPSPPKSTPEKKKRLKGGNDDEPKPPPKTPDTFFMGKNRKHFKLDINDFASQVAADPLNVLNSIDHDQNIEEEEDDMKIKSKSPTGGKLQLPVNGAKNLEKSNSSSSDLDKTFSPEIISVNSDITEPTYSRTSSNRKNGKRSWRKWRRIREDFSDTCRQHDMRTPLSVLDSILDALCSGPSTR